MALCFCLVLLITVKSAFSARVAGLAIFSTGSHYFVVRKAMEELASRGHEVIRTSFLVCTFVCQLALSCPNVGYLKCGEMVLSCSGMVLHEPNRFCQL